jgi:DNA polymerase-4
MYCGTINGLFYYLYCFYIQYWCDAVRKIIHCDADCFFAAVEIRDDPLLRGRPVAVGGGQVRGVISTCNYEARRYGVTSAMSSVQALRLCPDLIILPHRMEVYRDVSMAMRHIFYEFTDLVEPLSLDEAFLDVSDTKYCHGSGTLIAMEIRQRIKAELGICVSAGVAPNKFLAKVASDWHKPDGLFVISPDQVIPFVKKLPVRKIYGVGKAMAAKLAELNIKTCGDLQQQSVFELTHRFGQMGLRLCELSRGIDDRQVSTGRRRKSLSVERTYPVDLPNVSTCLDQLPLLLQELTRRLAPLDQAYQIVKLFVKLKFSDFRTTTIETGATAASIDLYAGLCRDAYKRISRPVRLLGVGVRFVDLREDRAFHQLDLFG